MVLLLSANRPHLAFWHETVGITSWQTAVAGHVHYLAVMRRSFLAFLAQAQYPLQTSIGATWLIASPTLSFFIAMTRKKHASIFTDLAHGRPLVATRSGE